MQSLTVDQVVDLLEKEECTANAIQIFKTEHIDGKAFLLLKDKDLKELGLVMGDRLKIGKLLEDIHKEESGAVMYSSTILICGSMQKWL